MSKEILGYKCLQCGHVHYPYRSRCRKCGHTHWRGADIVWEVVPLATRGRLLTFTDLFALPPDFEAVKLTLGIVQLEDGQRVTGQLQIANPQMGMPVRAQIEPVRQEGYTKHWGMVFYRDDQ